MTTGDPKQATILAVVALAVVGFAIFRVIPKPEVPVALPISPRLNAGDSNEKKLPTLVYSNAFWHPRLSSEAGKDAPKRPTTVAGPKTMSFGKTAPANPFSQLPNVFGPDENTGNSQQPKEGPTIKVSAIIATDQRKEALISFGGTEEVKASAGMRFGDLIVVAVTETSIRIRVGKAEKTIAVGEEQKLWINENKKP